MNKRQKKKKQDQFVKYVVKCFTDNQRNHLRHHRRAKKFTTFFYERKVEVDLDAWARFLGVTSRKDNESTDDFRERIIIERFRSKGE